MNAAKIRDAERFARGVYAKCRDCEGDYKNFANNVRSVQNGLQDIDDALASNPIDALLDNELGALLTDCESALGQLSGLVDRFNNLPLQSQRTWDRLSWGQQDETNLRQRLDTLSHRLEAFYKRLRESPTAQLDRALQLLAKEVSNGRHETTTATSLSTTAVDPDDNAGWDQIIRDLGDLGVAEKTVTQNKEHIVDWILRAINDGILTDEKMPVEPETIPSPPRTHIYPIDTPPEVVRIASPQSQPSRSPMRLSDTPPEVARLFSPPSLSSGPPAYAINTPPEVARSPLQASLVVVDQRAPSVSPPSLHPSVSIDVLNQVSTINMDEPPSPIEPEPAESNILWNAQRINYHWNRREWRQARENVEAQIGCAERGEFVDVSGFPQQPDARILKHLLGVCYSLSGDFIKARETFESVLTGPNVHLAQFDDGDIAAARWLGETCIMANQVVNASLAWAIAYYGCQSKYSPDDPGRQSTWHMLEDLRLLNTRTSGLNILKQTFANSNRDASTILGNIAGTTKFQIVETALTALAQYARQNLGPRRLAQNVSIAEGFLIQPLVAQKSWPLPQDPFFRVESSIELLYSLSRPRSKFNTAMIPNTSLGSSKNLVYVTKNSIDWLVDAIRYALNTYAVEWKIRYSEYLLRISQTHDRIAYYDCFVIKFRKLSFRSLHGFKLSESAYSTRQFTSMHRFREDGSLGSVTTQADELARKEKLRTELAERLKDYVKQAEIDLANGNWPPAEPFHVSGPYEADSAPVHPSELGDQRAGWELPGQSAIRRKPVRQPVSYEIAELPG